MNDWEITTPLGRLQLAQKHYTQVQRKVTPIYSSNLKVIENETIHTEAKHSWFVYFYHIHKNPNAYWRRTYRSMFRYCSEKYLNLTQNYSKLLVYARNFRSLFASADERLLLEIRAQHIEMYNICNWYFILILNVFLP